MPRYYSAQEASKKLGVSRNTLYAYVSRGLIRSEPISPGHRSSRYHALDVDRLATRSGVHKAPVQALQGATDWGAPIMESAITLIGDETFYYRGQAVPHLAETGSFEQTVALLWDTPATALPQQEPGLQKSVENKVRGMSAEAPIDQFLALLALLNQQDAAAFRFTPQTTIGAGVLMTAAFLRVITGHWPHGPVAEHLAAAWQLASAAQALINSTLILTADHELNLASFTARCAASAGCSPYAAVAAATHTFFGRRHGGNTERIRGLLHEADGRGNLYEAIASRIKRGDPVPGFGHRLYNRDPRAAFVLSHLPDQSGYITQALTASDELLAGAYPTIDFAVIMLEKDLALPEQAGTHLFYLGRLSGLTAHILEQYNQNRPIRPRAQYVGVAPNRENEQRDSHDRS